MPCDSSHMESTPIEKRQQMLLQLIDELDGKGPPNPATFGNGYDERVYNKATKEACDQLARTLCERLGKKKSLSKYSLEMQIWWRDHKEADKKRMAKEGK